MVIDQAPTGEHFQSWKRAAEFCKKEGIKLPPSRAAGSGTTKGGTGPLTLPNLTATLRKLAEGDFKGTSPAAQAALLRARQARCLKRSRGTVK